MATMDIIAEAIGYKRLKYILTVTINPDGSCTSSIRVRIRAMIDRLKRVHITLLPERIVPQQIEFQIHYKDCEDLMPSQGLDAQGNYFIY